MARATGKLAHMIASRRRAHLCEPLEPRRLLTSLITVSSNPFDTYGDMGLNAYSQGPIGSYGNVEEGSPYSDSGSATSSGDGFSSSVKAAISTQVTDNSISVSESASGTVNVNAEIHSELEFTVTQPVVYSCSVLGRVSSDPALDQVALAEAYLENDQGDQGGVLYSGSTGVDIPQDGTGILEPGENYHWIIGLYMDIPYSITGESPSCTFDLDMDLSPLPPVDLAANGITGVPSEANLGDVFSPTLQLTNVGTDEIQGTETTQFYLVNLVGSDDSGGGTGDFIEIPVGSATQDIDLTSGQSVLQTATVSIPEETPPGQYFLSAHANADGAIQETNPNDNNDIADGGPIDVLPGAPSTPDLIVADDTGALQSDGVTDVNMPAFVGFVEAGTTSVEILVDGSVAGQGPVLNGTYQVSVGSPIADGEHEITAVAIDSQGGQSDPSAPSDIVIDTAPPTAVVSGIVFNPGQQNAYFNVTYDDSLSGLDLNNDFRVVAYYPDSILSPATQPLYPQILSITDEGDQTLVRYQLTREAGTWSWQDSGTWTIKFSDPYLGDVNDVAGNHWVSTTFDVDVPWVTIIDGKLQIYPFGSGHPPIRLSSVAAVRGAAPADSSASDPGSDQVTVSQGDNSMTFPTSDFNEIDVTGSSGDNEVDFDGVFAQPIVFTGGGGTDSIDVDSGSCTFGADTGGDGSAIDLNVASDAAVTFNATQHLASLDINSDASAQIVSQSGFALVTQSLEIDSGGYLDINDSPLIQDYAPGSASPLDAIQGYLVQGFTGGAWTGPGGIISTTAANDSSGNSTVGIWEASQLLGLSGDQTGVFDGEAVDATAVLVGQSLVADANHDGTVNALDFNALATNYGQPGTFGQGDFDYSGTVDSNDFALLASRYGTVLAPPSGSGMTAQGVGGGSATSLTAKPANLFGNQPVGSDATLLDGTDI